MAEPTQEELMDFERNRNQLISISAQKQQLQVQSATLGKAVEELEKTTEKKVYKAVGNILILTETLDAKKEIVDAKETTDLRIKTLQKQEDATLAKLNALRNKIEGKLSAGAQEAEATKDTKKPKKEAGSPGSVT